MHMALDFHRLDTNEHLFGLDDEQFDYLSEIFQAFTRWTGLVIDQYGDFKLTADNQKTLVRIIEKYVSQTDLDKDKQKTSVILEFKGILGFLSNRNIDLKLLGD